LRKKAAAKKIQKNICSSRQHFLYTEIRSQLKNGETFILDTLSKRLPSKVAVYQIE
jgi:nucleoid-associated protein YejK